VLCLDDVTVPLVFGGTEDIVDLGTAVLVVDLVEDVVDLIEDVDFMLEVDPRLAVLELLDGRDASTKLEEEDE
jgi:hypothetical protein